MLITFNLLGLFLLSSIAIIHIPVIVGSSLDVALKVFGVSCTFAHSVVKLTCLRLQFILVLIRLEDPVCFDKSL